MLEADGLGRWLHSILGPGSPEPLGGLKAFPVLGEIPVVGADCCVLSWGLLVLAVSCQGPRLQGGGRGVLKCLEGDGGEWVRGT